MFNKNYLNHNFIICEIFEGYESYEKETFRCTKCNCKIIATLIATYKYFIPSEEPSTYPIAFKILNLNCEEIMIKNIIE